MYCRTPSAARIFGTSSRALSMEILHDGGWPSLLRIVCRERACDEGDDAAAVTWRPVLDAKHHIIADVGDHARRHVERRLPDLQRVIDPRAWRTGGIGLEESFRVCGHDYPLPKAARSGLIEGTSERSTGDVRFGEQHATWNAVYRQFVGTVP